MSITEGQFSTSLQNIQNRHIKFELLNFQYQIVDTLEGVSISGNFSIDANSDIRRTGNISLVVTDSSFRPESGGKIWLDKYIRVFVGIEKSLTKEIVWTNCGVYIIDEPTYSYDAVTNTLSLSLLDLMSKLTGIRNGYLKGLPVVLSAGENIRQAIIDTLALGGFNKYIVQEAPSPGIIPNDLEFSQGATIYELLSSLRDIYPNYEMFFNVDGVFVYQPIPTGEGENVIADDSLWDSVVLSENFNTDFQNVKNSIEVYGRTHNPSHFSTTTEFRETPVNFILDLYIPGVTVVDNMDDIIFGFILENTESNLQGSNLDPVYVSINFGTQFLEGNLIDDNGGTAIVPSVPNGQPEYFCIQRKGNDFYWLGHLQAYGFAEDNNPKSPFYVNGSVGRIRLPLFDGEYSNCLTDNFAQQRAEYELWLHTNMNNSITLSTIPVFWLDVNSLVRYTSKSNKTTEEYLIKSINFGLGENDTQSINMIKYYPDFNTITRNSKIKR